MLRITWKHTLVTIQEKHTAELLRQNLGPVSVWWQSKKLLTAGRGWGHSGTQTGFVPTCRQRLCLLLLRTVSRVYGPQIPFPGEWRLSEEKHARVAAGEAFPVPTSRLHSTLFRTAVTMCIAHMNENTQTHGHDRARKQDTRIKHR